MNILIIPLLLIVSPTAVLYLILFKTKNKSLSLKKKIILVIFFITVGLIASLYAITISMNGMVEQNIKCITGVIMFIPLAIIVNFIGTPLLIFIKSRS